MNKRHEKLIPLVIGFLVISAIFVFASEEEVSFVSDSGYEETMRPPVVFNHDAHNEAAGLEDCASCHHVYDDDGKQVEDESSEDMECSECHLKPEDKNRMNLTKYYHLSCRGCHIESKKGPVMCGECHKR